MDRPAASAAPVVPQGIEFAGRSAKDKIAELQAALAKNQADAALITMLNSIAWLFNIRGADISHAPLVLATAIVPREGKALLFVDPAKLTDNVRGHLADAADILPAAALEDRLKAFGAAGAKVRLDPDTAPARFAQIMEGAGATLVLGEDPCILPKAIKTEAEIAGARAAHLRDGAAMSRFLAWLDETSPSGGR